MAQQLRGRSASDVRNAWIDHVLGVIPPDSALEVHDDPVPDARPFSANTGRALQQRAPLLLRESEYVCLDNAALTFRSCRK